jgi:hypothetical protein
MIFFGIKTYRDQFQNGVVTFLQGCKIGLGIAVVAGLLYAVTWEIYYNVAASDHLQQYTEYQLNKMKADGASAEELQNERADMERFIETYKNPFIRFGMTLLEILPVGIIITLISSAILRKRQILPA